jgi:hypothetical protein
MEARTMTKEEKEDNRKQQLLEKIRKISSQLSPWELFQVYLYIKWMTFQLSLRRIELAWLVFQLDLDEKLKARHK